MNMLAVRWAMKRRLGDSYAKAVLVDLACEADEAGLVLFTLEKIARRTCMSVRTVKLKIRWLENMGFVRTAKFPDFWGLMLQLDSSSELESRQSGRQGAD